VLVKAAHIPLEVAPVIHPSIAIASRCPSTASEATPSWLAAYRHVVEALASTHPAIAAQLPSDLPPETDGMGARDAALAALRVAYPLVQGSLCVSARQPAAEDSSALEEVAAVLHQVRRHSLSRQEEMGAGPARVRNDAHAA
jgi:hypothetical protein